MKQPVKGTRARGRPRSEHRKQAILEAAQALLEEGGPGAVTMEAVAARAGVGKPTV
jgi:AcrR family transcriptional regulator